MAYISTSNENFEFTYHGLKPVHDINEVKITNEEYEFTYYGLIKVLDINDKSRSRMMLMRVG